MLKTKLKLTLCESRPIPVGNSINKTVNVSLQQAAFWMNQYEQEKLNLSNLTQTLKSLSQ